MNRLYIDDARPTPEGFTHRAYSAAEAIDLLKSCDDWELVSFDHDLGDASEPEQTGYTVALWVEEQAYHARLSRFKWKIHSANPVGRKRMRDALEHADRYWST